MRKALAIVAVVILTLLGLLLLLVMLNVTGMPLCSDREAVRTADECVEATAGERTFGLAAGWAAVACAAVAVVLGLRYAARAAGAGRLALAAALTPVLGLLAVAFLPVSF